MEFLNIGSAELLFLLLIAILVVGPRRAAELASQGGRLMARLRREWTSVRRDLMVEVAALERDAKLEDKSAGPPRTVQPSGDKSAGSPRTVQPGGDKSAGPPQTIEHDEDKAG